MKNFLSIVLFLISQIYAFLSRTFRDYVIPTINFINAIKFLIFDKDYSNTKQGFNFKKFFIDRLGLAEHYIEKLLELFIKCIKIILPNEIEGNTFEEGLRSFIAYLQTLKDGQKALLYFKLASLMVFYWINGADNNLNIKEHESDFMVQLAYTRSKLRGKQESFTDPEPTEETVKDNSKSKANSKKK